MKNDFDTLIHWTSPAAVVQKQAEYESRIGSWKANVSARSLVNLTARAELNPIDPHRFHGPRGLATFTVSDTNWGETDSLANIPRKASILRAPAAPHEEGDR